MKQARKSLRVMIVSFLFTLVVVPFSNVQRTLPEHFPFQGAAWAAEDQSYLTEPFAVQPQEVPDPLESLNRGFFKFNDRFYFWVLKPVSQTYKTLVPQGVRTSVRNAFQNVAAPVRIVNNLLQLNVNLHTISEIFAHNIRKLEG
jgi:ABC-type transporter lipoprotein component MlaA